MSESAIRAQIKSTLENVSGIGVVHDYERYSRSIAEFLSLMTSGSPAKINGWTIHRQETSAERVINPAIDRYHTYIIAGIYELDDASASEKDFQGLLESIFSAFKGDITLSGNAVRCDPISIDSVDTIEYGKRLFHTAELSLKVLEREYY